MVLIHGNGGFSMRLFFPQGEPEGLRLVEKSNRTVQGVVFPRAQFPEARKRPELARTGVYVLWGPGESGQHPRVYVGEGDAVLSRLEQHARQKDFWTHGAVFISKDQNLNKAHVQYLEARLVALATEVKKADLDNGNVPQLPALSEADQADAEEFLADLLLCLPVVGVNFFDRPRITRGEEGDVGDLFVKGKGVEARGRDAAEGFVVRGGSWATKEEVPSIPRHVSDLRRDLLRRGVLEDQGERYRLTQDYAFDSPSTAAGVLLGRSVNGRTTWKNVHGLTLKNLQEIEAS